MRASWVGAVICIVLMCGAAEASVIGFTYSGSAATGGDNLHLYTPAGGYADAGPVVVSVSYDPAQLIGCAGGADFSNCSAPLGAGSVSASFTTTDLNNVTHTFTETGGAPLLSPVVCPEGYCSDTGGGVHIYNSGGFASAQFYAFGPDGHYLAGGWSTSLPWQSNVSAANQSYDSQMLASITGITWFYSGQFTSASGPDCGGPNEGPYCGGANFAPGDYYGGIGDLAPVVSAPEPATWPGLTAGILCVGALAMRRRKACAR